MTAVRRVKVPFADVGGELGSDVSQRSIAGNNKSAIHAKFGTHGFTDTQLTCSIPHQLGEVTRLVLIGLIEEIVATYLVIPDKMYGINNWVCLDMNTLFMSYYFIVALRVGEGVVE